MKSEYGVGYRQENLAHQYIRRLPEDVDPRKLKLTSDTMWVQDVRENNLLIFPNDWSIRWATEKNEGLELLEFNQN